MFGKFVCIFEFEVGEIQGLAREIFMQSKIRQITQRKRIKISVKIRLYVGLKCLRSIWYKCPKNNFNFLMTSMDRRRSSSLLCFNAVIEPR